MLDRKTPLTGHANGMAFYAYDASGQLLLKRIYYSIGGGFVVSDEELQRMKSRGAPEDHVKVPYPFASAARNARDGGGERAVDRRDEARQRRDVMSGDELDAGLDGIWAAMKGCIERGLSQEGIMPGGLKVRRRAR